MGVGWVWGGCGVGVEFGVDFGVDVRLSTCPIINDPLHLQQRVGVFYVGVGMGVGMAVGFAAAHSKPHSLWV